MQYSHQIVSAINKQIQSTLSDARFSNSEYHGIAVLAKDGDNLRPLITSHYDTNKFITADFQIPLRIYHRTIGISRRKDVKIGYGDNDTEIKEETTMALIAIGNRSLIQLTPEELEAAIVASMPANLSKATRSQLKLKSCIITPTTSILDPVEVYMQENKTDIFELPPNSLMIRINYSINSTYDRACFSLCDC